MLRDTNQNFWQMASIQATAMGLPVMLVGEQIANLYSVGAAISSLLIGNLILWLIGLSMFSMTYKGQGNAKHALENVLTYFGKPIACLAALVLMVAFISWFSFQIFTQSDFTNALLRRNASWNATSNMVATLIFSLSIIGIATLGIRAIKWICTFAFPLLLLYVIFAMVKQTGTASPFQWDFSLPGVILVVIIVFPGIINLPTFFRHARSRADGVLALTVMTVFVILFQAASIWMKFKSNGSELFLPYSPETGWTGGLILVLAFTLLSTFCVNLVNIYFASAALELIVPNFSDARGYAILGVIGAIAFGLLGGETIASHLETITNNFIGSLGVILLAAYLARNIITHRHRHHEKLINILCWGLGCVVSFLILYLQNRLVVSFVGGIVTSLIAFIAIIFVEETVWSIRQIFLSKKSA